MPRRRLAIPLAGAMIAALGLLAACTAGPSTRPGIVVNDEGQPRPAPPSESAVPVPPLEEPSTPSSRWRECTSDVKARLTNPPLPAWLPYDCDWVTGTLDTPYAPGRGTARLHVLRVGAGPIPIVVVNDVDGQPGTIYAARLAARLPQEFFARFSLIGLDRRGTGNSDPANCVPPEIRAAIVGTDPSGLDVNRWLELAQTAGQQCQITLETRLPALDTWRSAVDLDKVRQRLGLSRLHAIGHGEGSRVLTVFADRFPDRVGRMVLDGVPDPTQDAAVALEGVASGAEATYRAFADQCAALGCELAPDAKVALTDLLGRLRTEPLSSPSGVEITAGAALHAVLIGLADRAGWPSLATAIDRARNGDGSGLGALVAPVIMDSREQAATLDGSLVTECNDTTTRLAPAQISRSAADWNGKFPLFGALIAERLALCSPWTVPSGPLPTPTARNAPPIVVLGTANDPVTPLQGTERAAHQLVESVLLSWQGAGHGAVGVSGCATDAALRFLTDGQVPRNGTVCPP